MTRKFVSIVPHQMPDDLGTVLYAVADDGTSWRAKQYPRGTLPDEPWVQIPGLPEDDGLTGAYI